MKKKKKRKKWMKFRHRVVRLMLGWFVGPYTKLKYGVKIDKFKEEGKRPYLILYNHQTAFDQFMVGLAFRQPVYYVATEDLFSNGFLSSLIRWLVEPIPIKKQVTDVTAVMTCMRLAKEGGTIAIAPEGNRTYSGDTVYISPAIAGLAKNIKLPIALYRIEGGYGVQPRWSDKVRRGKMHTYVSRVIEPEEYADLSNEELYEIIKKELTVKEGVADGLFLSSKKAEYLERAIYVCPECGLSVFESHRNEITCTKCNKSVLYGADKTLTGVGFEFPFRFVSEWYEYQNQFVSSLDTETYTDTPMYCDSAKVSEVIVYKKKKPLKKNAEIKLYSNRIVIEEGTEEEMNLPFEKVSAASVLGRNKLNLYYDKKIYQLKSNSRFNALKYVNMYYHYKNSSKEEGNIEFLGL